MRWLLIFILLFLPGCDTLKGATAGLMDAVGWVWDGTGWVLQTTGKGIQHVGDGSEWVGDQFHSGADWVRTLGNPKVAQARPNYQTPPPPRHFQSQQMATCQALQQEDPRQIVCTADGIGQACNRLRLTPETSQLYLQAMRGATGQPQYDSIRNLCTPQR